MNPITTIQMMFDKRLSRGSLLRRSRGTEISYPALSGSLAMIPITLRLRCDSCFHSWLLFIFA
jgi:hypothetical protein